MPDKPLIVGVDIRDLKIATTGTRTYLIEICNEFKKMESDQLRFHFFDTQIKIYTGANKILKLIEHLHYHTWKQITLPLKALFKHCDILFCTDNFVPLIHLGYKTIPVLHDAFVFETPENYSAFWLKLYHGLAIPAAKRSPTIVTPTNYAKQQIHKFTGIDNEKLAVIYEGAKTFKQCDNQNNVLDTFNITSGEYLLHIGSAYKRKNIPSLIHAFYELKKNTTGLKLVLAGPTPTNKFGNNDYQTILNAIAETNLEKDVILTGHLTDEELCILYSNALIYIFPSINEGFGIPILEAFSFNIPVVAADNTALPEVGGDAVLLFNPFSVADMAEKIGLALNDKELRDELVLKGKERLKLFSWAETAKQLVSLFESVNRNS